MKRAVAILLPALSPPPFAALEVAGVKFDDTTTVGADEAVIDGAAKGSDIPGEDFYRALARIWLADKPVQDDLKEHLLGKAR